MKIDQSGKDFDRKARRMVVRADPLYQHLIVTANRKFWRCVEGSGQPTLFGVEPPPH